jgi:hypothetical protein
VIFSILTDRFKALFLRRGISSMYIYHCESYGDELRKGMVIAILADDPNYEYYLQKLTTGSELIEHNFSDSWSGTSDHGSRMIRG